MAAPTATWTALDTADWDSGDGVYADKFLEVLQDIYHLATNHQHAGGTADGALLPTADPKYIWLLTPPIGSPFA